MQTTTAAFDRLANSWVRPLAWRFGMAWDKARNENVSWGVYDQSLYDSGDVYASDPANQPAIQIWDTYNYHDVSDRVQSITTTRSIEFPYNVQSAICDVQLANHDQYFTPYSGSAIAQYMKQQIPVRAWLGFKGAGLLLDFVGLTEAIPEASAGDPTASVTAFDFLAWALSQPVPDLAPMADKKTDEILTAIFEALGFTEHQTDFTGATNMVPIFFPQKGASLAEIVKRLVQAENGRLWQNELGQIVFEGRGQYAATGVDYELNDDNVVSVKPSQAAGVVNHVKITTPIRVIAPYQLVSEKASSGTSTDNLWVVSAGLPILRDASLEDPCLDVVTPTLGENSSVSWFTAKTAAGTEVVSGVTCELILKPDKATLKFTSILSQPVEIDRIFLWGQPARQVDELKYEAFDDNWADDNDQLLEINDNEYFGNYDNARAFAQSVFLGYADYSPTIEAEIKGTPALQLGDVVDFDTRLVNGIYEVTKVEQKLAPSKLTTKITAKKTVIWSFGVYDISVYNGEDVYAV